jgi:hypothetical protein
MSNSAGAYLIPLLVGLIVLALIWVPYLVFGRQGVKKKFGSDGGLLGLGLLVEGADGRPSTSKFQFVLWTGVVLLAWVAIYVARLMRGQWDAVPDLPQNLLIVMGLSVVTATAAKAITVAYTNSAPSSKSSVASKDSSAAALFQDDDGFPDLSKIQMLAWTTIATGTYLVMLWGRLGTIAALSDITVCAAPNGACGLPDIDGALMVLMGLGQGAYVGKKLTMVSSPSRLTSLGPQTGKAGDSITIYGKLLGSQADGAYVTLNGTPIRASATAWTDNEITFVIPPTPPAGGTWTAPQQSVNVGVITSEGSVLDGLALVVTA